MPDTSPPIVDPPIGELPIAAPSIAGGGLMGRLDLAVLAALLMAGAAALEIASLLPDQGSGRLSGFGPMSHSDSLIAAHAVLAAGFLAAAGLCVLFGPRFALAGAAIAAGIVVSDLGLVVVDFGNVLPFTGAGGALWLEAVALVAGGLAVACGVAAQPPGSLRRGHDRRSQVNVTITSLTVLASIALGIALVPAWSRFQLVFTTVGASQTLLQGNPFSAGTPAAVAVGTILAAVAFGALPIAAVLGRPARAAVLVTVGVIVVVSSQAVSAIVSIVNVNVNTFVSSSALARAKAAAAGLVVHASLTWWFDVEVVAGLVLLVLVVARWWTPAGGSLFDSYLLDAPPRAGVRPSMTWIQGSTAAAPAGAIGHGSTAVSPPGTIGYGSTAVSSPGTIGYSVDLQPAPPASSLPPALESLPAPPEASAAPDAPAPPGPPGPSD